MPCKHFLHGNCSKGVQCTYIHAHTLKPTASEQTHCTHFNSPTGCRYGDKCKYKHPAVMCKHLLKGECTKGAACTFSHVPAASSVHSTQTKTITERSEKAPFEVTFLLDTSSSMRGEAIDKCKQAVLDIASIMRPQGKIGLSTFNHELQEVLPLRSKGQQGSKLEKAVRGINAMGGTALWDSIEASLSNLSAQEQIARKLFILTDGED